MVSESSMDHIDVCNTLRIVRRSHMRQRTNLLLRFSRWSVPFAIVFMVIDQGTAILGDELRLNQIQVIGTHNSYHIAPTPATLQLIEAANRKVAPTLDYTHRPLEEQFS